MRHHITHPHGMKNLMKELLWRVEWLVWDPAVEFLMGHMWARVLAIAVVSALASVLTILLLSAPVAEGGII